MKTLVLAALALFSVNSFAQSELTKQERKKEMAELRKQMTPEETATLKAKKMALHLDLTDKQQSEVYTVILEQTELRKAKQSERMAKKDGKRKKLTKDEYLKRENEKLDNQIAMKQKMKAILTPEQYAKFEKMKPRMKRRIKKSKKSNKQ